MSAKAIGSRPSSTDSAPPPVTWQGFALVLGFVLLLLADMRFVEPVAAKTIVAVTLLVSFVVLTWRKTDGGWRWHWGDFEK
ncbi:hypothetical protein BH09PSE4_BH09PSE4_23690 [soil metagenome]